MSYTFFNSKQKESFAAIKNKLSYKIQFYLDKIDKDNIKVICFKDEIFPNSLFSLKDFPSLLFIKCNEFKILSNYNFIKSIAVVGTRDYTKYGEYYCREFVKNLSKLDICFISGLAYGIDSIAHDEALKNNAFCIGVLGCGFDFIYPYSSKKLYEKIVDLGGILITEYLPDQNPDKANFPARNRIIAALARGVLIVEADKNSGSLITANIAFELGRLVFAIPADLNKPKSQGCNYVISKNIAKLVMNHTDILEEFDLISTLNLSSQNSSVLLNANHQAICYDELLPYEKKVYEIILKNKLDTDQIIEKSELEPSVVFETLTNLEAKKLIYRGEDELWYPTK